MTARIGDKPEFQVIFINGSDFAPEVIIKDELSEHLKFIEGEAYTYGINEADDKIIEADEIVSTGLKIKECAPDTEIIIRYTVEVVGTPSAENDLAWD